MSLLVAVQRQRTDLMGSADQVQIVFVQELRDDLAAEGKRHAAIVLAPTVDFLVRI